MSWLISTAMVPPVLVPASSPGGRAPADMPLSSKLAVQVKTEDGRLASSWLDMQEAPTALDSHQLQAAVAQESEMLEKW